MTRGEAKEFIAQSVKSDVDMALVADAIKALEQEPTTKNCRTCKNFGSHHGICEICKDNKCWTEKELTADNDSAVDCISRKVVLDAIDSKAWEFCDYLISKGRNDEQKPVSHFADNLRECVSEELPSVTPQEPIDYKTQYENYLKKSGVVISQLRADRDRLQDAFDKIRAEITNHLQIMDICDVKKVNGVIVQSELVNRKVVLYDSVMQIIDKYKEESGDKK